MAPTGEAPGSGSDAVEKEHEAARKGERADGWIESVVRTFLGHQLPILLVAVLIALGAAALLLTPREEDPQIEVTMADVLVQVPGASAHEVENLALVPLQRLLWQVEGVEHIYSTASRGRALVTVRFEVGQHRETALTRLHEQIRRNVDRVPAIVDRWLVKPVGVEDVPVLALTLHSDRYSGAALRRIAEELRARLATQGTLSKATIIGGRPREVRVELDPALVAGRQVTPLQIARALRGADASLAAGAFDRADQTWRVETNVFFTSVKEIQRVMVASHDGQPVYLGDVATIRDGPREPAHYVRAGYSHRSLANKGWPLDQPAEPAVTIALAKKTGTNAVEVVSDVFTRLAQLEELVLPTDVEVLVSRNYGRTAANKSSTLIQSLLFAVITVVALLAVALGWREALIVAVAVPLSFAGALFSSYLLGYTLNRVTMFALIVSLGLIVDDPITNVDNIQRHIRESRGSPVTATLAATKEVLPPVLMSTLAIILSFTPLFFITGMMGPYMAPMAADVPLTVGFSTLLSLTVVPWLALLLLRGTAGHASGGGGTLPGWLDRTYRATMAPLLDSRGARWGLFGVITVLLMASLSLVVFRQVPVKMLPFDDKNELQLVVDLPEGTTLERTDIAVRDLERFLQRVPEVDSFVSYVGVASPLDFNGLVRHYFLRSAPHEATVRVTLTPKADRKMQSHPIALRLRNDLERIAERHDVSLKIVERPPGPPVLATVVAELSGAPDTSYATLLAEKDRLEGVFRSEEGIVEVDSSAIAPHDRLDLVVDRDVAGLHGVSPERVARTLRLALSGVETGQLHEPRERQPLPVRTILPEEKRSHRDDLGEVRLMSKDGSLVPLSELGEWVERPVDQPIMHKDLEQVVMIYADAVGRSPVTGVFDLQRLVDETGLREDVNIDWSSEGEWQITRRVFRDLGVAFGAALAGIYVLLVLQTYSFFLPLILMLAIPLTLLGILPGFWLLNAATSSSAGGYATPVFFTATSMIGVIALGGIVIRNSVVLLDFVMNERRRGASAREATLVAGSVRMRPILLTAMTTALGVWPITLDPIFSGLAWALIFGLVASTAFSLVVVPTAYYAFYGEKQSTS
jgi:multidrug efflux pump subunit AcrB